jgi:predicted lipid-binding transport protein (Tim44 family)
MMKIVVVFLAGVFLYGTALAQELMIYPAKNQSKEQIEKDKYACYSWAKGETGFDPMATPQAATPPPAQQKQSVARGVVRGGVGGAALGAGIGAIAGGGRGAGKGAGIGALAGGTLGGVRSSSQNRQAEQAQQQREQEQAAQYQQKRNNYNRAYSACLEGRGYTVK